MICPHCQREIADHSNFCCFCGARQAKAGPRKRLTRSITDYKIAGVCGGIAEYLDIDSTWVRLLWAILSVFPGGFLGGILAYLAAWFIVPKAAAPVPVPMESSPSAARSS